MKQLRGTDLKRFLRDYRRAHPLSVHQIAILLEDVEYPANVGSIFRLADACGVAEVVLTGITVTPPNPTLEKVARGRQRTVPWRYERDPRVAIAGLREQGYTICALEITESASPYYAYRYPARVCLVAGHEDHGVTQKTLALCDSAIFVPMYGKGQSLNVHVAVGVVCYHIRHTAIAGVTDPQRA